jgi:hypothetical protein
MVSPVMDIDVGTIYEMGERLEQAVTRTMQEVDGNARKNDRGDFQHMANFAAKTFARMTGASPFAYDEILHVMFSFVSQDVRTFREY